MRRSEPWPGWVLFGLALALRAGWVIVQWSAQGAALEYPDEDLHWQLATNLVREGTLVSDDGRLAARMPLYPLFLAFFAGLDQAGILLARLTQAALGAATVYVGYRLAEAAFDRRVALVAGLLLCCDPFAIFLANLLLTEVLFTFLALSLTACAWLYVAQRRPATALLGLGVLGAAVILTRPSAALWVPLLWLLVWTLSVARRKTVVQLLLCPLLLGLLMLPWGLRNQAALGSFAWLSTNGGVTLYDAQGPQADGSSNQAFLQQIPQLDGLDEVERDRALQQAAVAQMRKDPQRVLHLAGVKFLRTWSPMPNVPELRTGTAARIGAAFTIAVLIGAALGLVRALVARLRLHQLTFWRLMPGPRSFHTLLWLPVVYFTLLHCVYVGSLRYRVPLMAFVELAAATALARPLKSARP